ncbi:MAG: nucleotidyltransferase [Anaerolineae bacterium]|nr:nucleotidyltransferase [Anaerolineae bacterium]MCO5188137.1 nucleotidyltransferase [Anaerolineae bacterium]MCO5193009.1 nucleotidyltransferase [Anaerolineae bacterium]MCO5205611.1 nucleotidyltransferase [Anaerolineae bacterium]
MHKLTNHFGQLLENIQPPQDRLDTARDLPPKVRDYLRDHELFATVIPHSRLAGSYAQRTCVGDVKDVDFLVTVDGDPENNEPEAKQVVQDLKKALDDLPQALGYDEGETVVERNRRSVHVYFKDEDFHVDAVPCIAPDGIENVVYVPDRNWNKWIKSQPIGYVQLITDLDREYHKKVRPLMKLIKQFRNEQMIYRRPKSYWLGALVIYHIRRDDGLDTTKSLGELFHDLVDAIHVQYDHLLWTSDTATPNLEDPMLGHNISWNWSRSHFETFMRRLDEARQCSEKALAAQDRSEAIEHWQSIFGEAFPIEIEEAAQNMAHNAWPGVSKTTPTGLIVPATASAPKATRIKPTKFHGET